MAKAGRKRDHYVTSWGETIVDLGRRPDGRWVDLEDRDHPWVCDDEPDAIAEFYHRRAKRLGHELPFTRTTLASSHSRRLLKQLIPHREPPDFFVSEDAIPEDEFWSLVGEMIRKNPKLAARKTGIEELAYIKDLKPPPPPLTLKRVGELYCGKRDSEGRHASKDPNDHGRRFDDPSEGRKSWRCWLEFCEALKPVESVEEIANVDLHHYHAATQASGPGGPPPSEVGEAMTDATIISPRSRGPGPPVARSRLRDTEGLRAGKKRGFYSDKEFDPPRAG